jgi:hypothetical protein
VKSKIMEKGLEGRHARYPMQKLSQNLGRAAYGKLRQQVRVTCLQNCIRSRIDCVGLGKIMAATRCQLVKASQSAAMQITVINGGHTDTD